MHRELGLGNALPPSAPPRPPPRAMPMALGCPCRVRSAGRGEKRYLGHPLGSSAPLPALPDAPVASGATRSYLVGGGSPLAVGALQEPGLFGEFI